MLQKLADKLLYRFTYTDDFEKMALEGFEYHLKSEAKKHKNSLNILYLYPILLGAFHAVTRGSGFLMLFSVIFILGGGLGIIYSLLVPKITYGVSIVLGASYLLHTVYCIIFKPPIGIPLIAEHFSDDINISVPFGLISGLLGIVAFVATICMIYALEHIGRHNILIDEIKKERDFSKKHSYSNKAVYRKEPEPIYYDKIVSELGEENLSNIDILSKGGKSGGDMEEIVLLEEIKGNLPKKTQWQKRPQSLPRTESAEKSDEKSDDDLNVLIDEIVTEAAEIKKSRKSKINRKKQ